MQRRLSVKSEVFEIQVDQYQMTKRKTVVEVEQIDSGEEDDFENQKYIDEAFGKLHTEKK